MSKLIGEFEQLKGQRQEPDNSEKINQESIIPFEYRNIVNG